MMLKVFGKELIYMIYSLVYCCQSYFYCVWDFLFYVVCNIVLFFVMVYEYGYVVGDVNQNSFMVGCDSKVVLIDSDFFQINVNGILYLCEVGVLYFMLLEL